MDDLYLIRRESLQILGPFNAVELVQAMGRLQFSGQDEICGGFRPWVSLDSEKLKKIYPEIHRILNYQAADIPAMSSEQPIKLSGMRITMFGIAVSVLAIFLLVLAGGKKVLLPIEKKTANALYNYEAYDMLNSFLSKVANLEITDDDYQNEWLPFMRWSMFYRLKSGYNSSILDKSSLIFSNKGSCTRSIFEDLFRGSVGKWSSSLRQYQGSTEAWYRILLLNARSLTEQSEDGWLLPANEEASCIVLAFLVFENISLDSNFLKDVASKEALGGLDLASNILKRLRWQKQTILGEVEDDVALQKDGSVIYHLSCMEQAKTQAELGECYPNVVGQGESWALFFRQRFLLEQIRFIKTRKKLSKKELTYLEGELANSSNSDVFIDFKYEKEYQFLSEVINSNGDVKTALDKVQSATNRKLGK